MTPPSSGRRVAPPRPGLINVPPSVECSDRRRKDSRARRVPPDSSALILHEPSRRSSPTRERCGRSRPGPLGERPEDSEPEQQKEDMHRQRSR